MSTLLQANLQNKLAYRFKRSRSIAFRRITKDLRHYGKQCLQSMLALTKFLALIKTMSKKESADNGSRTIGFRVNDPIYRWIENQAAGGESPHQVVQRLVRELAGSDGVAINSKARSVALVDLKTVNDRIDEQNDRIAILEAAIATFADSLKQS